jgi:alkanesulfonate monooxygenase
MEWIDGVFTVYSTCPVSLAYDPRTYRQTVARVAQWSERHGYEGLLVYVDNNLADPWLCANLIMESTDRVVPLVAVQPVFAHPFTVANSIASLAVYRHRAVHINLVTGGQTRHLGALTDTLVGDHDSRYDRLLEYWQVIRTLLTHSEHTSFEGHFYSLNSARLGVRPPDELHPRFFLSGSSAACMRASATIGATRLTYPAPPHEYAAAGETGIRIGIIARESRAEAWQVAHQRFPDDPQGRKSHRIATKLSPSTWHKELSRRTEMEDSPYWLLPFKTYKTFCPYLVGSYDEVGELLAFYHAEGVRTLILDTPSEEDDLYHAGLAFRAAGARTGLATTPAPAPAVLER